MKILALERELPTATSEAFRRHAADEARKAWELQQTGLIRELYFRADQQLAVLILECVSTGEATTLLAQLPFVRERLITFDLIPLKPYSGFARLFRETAGP
jgi:muconolactone delta-isomerase